MKLKKQNGLYNLYNGVEIIASTQSGLPNVLRIDIKQIEGLLGNADTEDSDLEKLVKMLKESDVRKYTCINNMGYSELERNIVKAFKGDADKKYTLQDIEEAIEFGLQYSFSVEQVLRYNKDKDVFIKSITKEQTEWDVEIEMTEWDIDELRRSGHPTSDLPMRPRVDKQGFINILKINNQTK